MTPIENPECRSCEVQLERIGREWFCDCCGGHWPVGEKRDPPKRPLTDLRGELMDKDDG